MEDFQKSLTFDSTTFDIERISKKKKKIKPTQVEDHPCQFHHLKMKRANTKDMNIFHAIIS